MKRGNVLPTIAFAIALFIKLIIVFCFPIGYPGDMAGWVETAHFISRNGIVEIYAFDLQGNGYPPLFFYPLWLSIKITELFTFDPVISGMALRLLPCLADSLICIVIFRISTIWINAEQSFIVSLLYALNPAVINNTAYMGMIGDPCYVLLIILGIYLFLLKKTIAAGLLLVMALLCKPQAAAFIPIFLMMVFLQRKPGNLLVLTIASISLIFAIYIPFIIAGTSEDVIRVFFRMANSFPYLHARADNLWFLLSRGHDPWINSGLSDGFPVLLGITPKMIGIVSFLVFNGIIFYHSWPVQDSDLILICAIVALAFFHLFTRMHVNYSISAFPFLTITTIFNKRFGLFALGLLTITTLVNWFDCPVIADLVNAGLNFTVFIVMSIYSFHSIKRRRRCG